MGMNTAVSTKHSPSAPEPEINVTPLVDVVLVLLIIFMVIAPNLQSGVAVELPELAAVDKRTREQTTEVVVGHDATLYLEEQPVGREALLEQLQRGFRDDPKRPVVIKADARLDYGTVRGLFADIQRIGYRSISMKVTAQKEEI